MSKEESSEEVVAKPAKKGDKDEEGTICIYCGYRVKPGEYHHH